MNSRAGCGPLDGAAVLEVRGHALLGGHSEVWRLEFARFPALLRFFHVRCARSLESAEHGLLILTNREQLLASHIRIEVLLPVEPASTIGRINKHILCMLAAWRIIFVKATINI